jgi:hypothetical protein
MRRALTILTLYFGSELAFAIQKPAEAYRGGDQRLDIVKTTSRQEFTVLVFTGDKVCSGELLGQGILVGRTLTVIPEDSAIYYPKLYPAPCKVTIDFDTRFMKAKISEGPYCTPWHGANCDFSGVVRRLLKKEEIK